MARAEPSYSGTVATGRAPSLISEWRNSVSQSATNAHDPDCPRIVALISLLLCHATWCSRKCWECV
jgi:hypothetical protein